MTTSNNSQIWVSALNEPARAAFPRTRVRFYDTTLRDGEQAVGVVMSPQQKLEFARQLDALGVGRIEAGFPRVSADDAEAIRLISSAGLRAEIWGFARAVPADVDELIKLGVRATVIEIPTSAIKLKAYGIAPEQAIERAVKAIRYAREHDIKVAFFAVDGSRSDLDFLQRVYVSALEAGAEEAVVVDTIGACGPEAVEELVSNVVSWLGKDVPVHFHGHNDFGLGTACAIAAIRAGATWIQGTVNGMGERAGNVDIGEVALALRCLYDVDSELDLTKLRETTDLLRRLAGHDITEWKPAVGDNLFMRESGAVASQFHIPEAIEPYAAELVAAERKLVLGKKSGLDSIDIKCRELGITIPEDKRTAVLAAVKQRGIEKRGLLTDQEFREIIVKLS